MNIVVLLLLLFPVGKLLLQNQGLLVLVQCTKTRSCIFTNHPINIIINILIIIITIKIINNGKLSYNITDINSSSSSINNNSTIYLI